MYLKVLMDPGVRHQVYHSLPTLQRSRIAQEERESNLGAPLRSHCRTSLPRRLPRIILHPARSYLHAWSSLLLLASSCQLDPGSVAPFWACPPWLRGCREQHSRPLRPLDVSSHLQRLQLLDITSTRSCGQLHTYAMLRGDPRHLPGHTMARPSRNGWLDMISWTSS